MANSLVGADPTQTYTAAQALQSGKGFGLGDRVAAHDGREYVWLQASGALAAGDAAFFVDGVFSASALSTANDARGNKVAIPVTAVASGEFFMGLVKGATGVNVAASCAANTRLNTTATAGRLDDDGTAGAMQVQGIYLTTAAGGVAAVVNAQVADPFIDVTL